MRYLSYTPVILSLVLITATCQTFQYSRGWTNGKRDNSANGFTLPDFRIDNFDTNNLSNNNDGSNVQCNLRKIKMLIQGDHHEQIYLCKLLDLISKINREEKLSSNSRHPAFENSDIDN
ncbi:pro-corazonin [Microplitis demolitor]|uniref:pro-corazonin n=1 Tax=Microplitis demolitor TaxID=69319 RepID=UPI0004CDC00B|nr:pro-corazonin [Microplitis demolitor]